MPLGAPLSGSTADGTPRAVPTWYDPDGQLPLPAVAADEYAREMMRRDRDADLRGMIVRRGIPYGTDRLQRYNLFAPADVSSAPVLLFWHGGGWTNGYREWVTFMAPALVRMGFVLVAPSYRLAPEDRLPAALEDGLAALDHVRATVGRDGGDIRRLYLAGHSAGGHLAVMTALHDAERGVSDPVRGCLPVSGIMDLRHPSPQPGSLEERAYSMVLREATDDAPMSPVCWASLMRTPLVLSYGERDSERVVRSNEELARIARAHDCLVELRQEANTDHFQTHARLEHPGHAWYRSLARLAGLG